MGEKKVTRMLLKVDLQCCKCYKKVKKVLCSFPHVRDQVFDEKANTVTIKVVCCSPEKIRDKIRCKGGASIKSIEIILDKPKEPEKPKQPEKPKAPEKPKEPEKPKAPEKPKEPEKSKAPEKPKEPEKPKAPEKPKEPEKPKAPEKPKEPEKPKVTFVEPPPQPKTPQVVPMAPGPAPSYPPTNYMFGSCYTECSQGRGGGPCNQICYGQPVRYYDGYCGRPVYDSWGGGGGGYRPYYAAKSCGECFSDDNPSGCSVM